MGNFLCVQMDRPGFSVFQALLHRGIIVRPVDNYGLPNFLRVTVGSESENSLFIDGLEEVLGKF
jgi:histidinol-phosphate aminotransferase